MNHFYLRSPTAPSASRARRLQDRREAHLKRSGAHSRSRQEDRPRSSAARGGRQRRPGARLLKASRSRSRTSSLSTSLSSKPTRSCRCHKDHNRSRAEFQRRARSDPRRAPLFLGLGPAKIDPREDTVRQGHPTSTSQMPTCWTTWQWRMWAAPALIRHSQSTLQEAPSELVIFSFILLLQMGVRPKARA